MRRASVAIAGGAIALGLLSRKVPIGVFVWDKSLGDALYPVMLHFLARAAKPSLAPPVLGAFALGTCFALELFQLTGLPARAPRVLRFVLGSAFDWHDVACYVVGATLALLADFGLRKKR